VKREKQQGVKMGKKNKKMNQGDNKNDEEAAVEAATAEKPSKWPVWKMLTAILFVVCIVLVIYAYDLRYDYVTADENLSMCLIDLENAEMKAEETDMQVKKMERDANAHGLGDASRNALPEKYIEEFKKKGLMSPENNLLNDLYHHQDLIPYNAPGNYVFRFTDRRLLYLLSPNRAFANFASRDVHGWLYLSYKVKNKDDIEWKVIDSYCPDLDK
jgi:hypothetical protein